MSFKIGDYVRFVNERQEGVVTRLVDSQIVGVTIDGDFEINVAITEIVKVNQTENTLIDHSEDVILNSPAVRIHKEKGIHLAAVNNAKAAQLFDLHLVNETGYELLFSCAAEQSGTFTGIASGGLAPFQTQLLTSITPSEGCPTLHFQFIFHGKKEFEPRQPLIKRFLLKPKSLFGQTEHLSLLDKQGFSWPLDQTESSIPQEKLQDFFQSTKQSEKQDFFIPEEEVDLHIEALREDWPQLNGEEILRYQLEHFRRCLEAAAAKGFEKIIFIHGVGNGTLRTEIHKRLGKSLGVKTFKDARKDRFGYGATEVFLK